MDPSDRPSIPEVVDRFRAYHAAHPTWGSLHLVLDDGNVENHNVDFCIQWAVDEGDPEGAELARILRQMSRTQRLKLGGIGETRKTPVNTGVQGC